MSDDNKMPTTASKAMREAAERFAAATGRSIEEAAEVLSNLAKAMEGATVLYPEDVFTVVPPEVGRCTSRHPLWLIGGKKATQELTPQCDLPGTLRAHVEWAKSTGAPMTIHKSDSHDAGWLVTQAEKLEMPRG